MEVLFFPTCHVTPHFETELEIAKIRLDQGDSVKFLVCNGELRTCLNNPEHLKSICIKCNSTIRNGLKLLESPNLRIINYPKNSIDYSKIPEEFNDIEELKKFKIDDSIEIGLGAASSLISHYNREHKLDTRQYKSEVYRELCTSYFLYMSFISYIIPEIKPDLLYIFNGRFSTSWPIVSLCKKTGLAFYTHERGGKMGNYMLVNNTIPHDYNWTMDDMEKVWNGGNVLKYEIGASFYSERRNRVVQAWYSFTTEQKMNSLPETFSKERKNIAIFNTTIEEYAAVKGWEKFIYLYDNEIDALKSVLNRFKDDSHKQFYLRVHPNLKGYYNTQTSDLFKLDKEFSNVDIIKPESQVDTYALMEESDIIIVMGSTVGIEASYAGKPVIQLALSPYNHLDSVYIPRSVNQFFEMIDSDLKPKDTLGAIKYGYWELSRGIKFKYFVQEGIFKGKFLNKRIRPDTLKYLFYDILEIRSLTDIKKLIRRRFPKK